ncbi:hypothetical protein [Saccharomonospora iraqiensis]|uniref:hypothetical protein n=1 Tax=Saccharomonospora iraqiensis TaxID=52698 RepID=UPI001F3A7BE9|nr:hypothetical protein [Saccharomonospora iraqiensis]
MPDFTVDIGGLTALEKNLGRTVENIEQALNRMEDIGPKSIGPDSLDEACADFKSDWEGGLEKIREAVDGIKGGVDKAIQGYAELEAKLEDTLQQMADEVRASEEQQA